MGIKKCIFKIKNETNESKILGPNNDNLSLIEDNLGFEIYLSNCNVYVDEDIDNSSIECVIKIFESLERLIIESFTFNSIDILNIIKAVENDEIDKLMEIYLKKELIFTLNSGKAIYPKTINQSLYLNSLKNNEICFGIGPAGTGKTYLAVLYAASLLKKQVVKKIVLVRPVVEAGEKLGFLPGDLKEKIDPYLIPLYDALYECFGKETVEKMITKGSIEVAPLAYMRGRTLANSVIILDEAQNATLQQMKMFLTRLGFGSKMIVTGDITQIDLNNRNQSGLIQATNILKNIKGLSFVYFERNDVMRNPIVYKIIERYEENE